MCFFTLQDKNLMSDKQKAKKTLIKKSAYIHYFFSPYDLHNIPLKNFTYFEIFINFQ
jgi:hypothetical protein